MKIRKISLIKISAILFLLSIFWSASAYAQPDVTGFSGAFDHKGSVTITGSIFGVKNTAAPIVWDDASGSSILSKWDGAWPNNNPTYNTIYRDPMRGTPLPHSHVTRYIAGAHGDSAGANSGYNVIFFKNLPSVTFPYYVYASWYERMDSAWVFGGDNNFKNFAYSVCCGPYQMPNNWYMNYGPPSFSSATASPQYQHNDDGVSLENPDENGHNGWWLWGANPTSRWLKIEMAIKLTSQTDGYIKLWEDGVLKDNYLGSTDKYPGTARTIGFGGYARNYGQPNNWRYFADAYLDTTLARVVLANNQTLSQATIIEPQIPTSWNSSSISFTVNLGKFQAGQTAYLFVVDPSGVSNAVGFPVTVGGTSGSGSGATPPSSSGSGGDSGGGSSGGSGCGFVKDNGKVQKAKSEGLAFAIMLIIALAGIAIVRKIAINKGSKGVKHIKRMIYFSLFFFVVFCIPVFANAADYYVATNGSDTTLGTQTLPWKTVQKAANTLVAGDTAYIRGGTYSENKIAFANSGTATQPITIKNYPGEKPIIDGGFSNNLAGQSAIGVFEIEGKSYITLDGLEIMRGWRANIYLGRDITTSNIIIQNCVLHDLNAYDNSGHVFFGNYISNITIRNNKMYKVILDPKASGTSGEGVFIGLGSGSYIIENNEMYNLINGVNLKYKQNDNNTPIVRNNLIHDVVFYGMTITSDYSIINNNIIYNSGYAGIKVYEESTGCSGVGGVGNIITHNTIVDNLNRGVVLNGPSACTGALDTILKDNLIYNFTSSEFRGLGVWIYLSVDNSNTTFDHNLIYSSSFSSPI